VFQTNSLIPDGYHLKVGDFKIYPENGEFVLDNSTDDYNGSICVFVSSEFVEALITKGFEVEEDPHYDPDEEDSD